jgi:hypothetical protein
MTGPLAGVSWTIDAAHGLPDGLLGVGISNVPGISWNISTYPMPSHVGYISFNAMPTISWTVSGTSPLPDFLQYPPIPNQTTIVLGLTTMVNITWDINSYPPPATINSFTVSSCPNVSGVINSSHPIPQAVTFYTVTLSAGITFEISAFQNINGIKTLRIENNLLAATVDTILHGVWLNKANFTYATPTLDLLGNGNQAPNGILQAANPPSTGKEWKYDLINGVYTTAGPRWTVQTA